MRQVIKRVVVVCTIMLLALSMSVAEASPNIKTIKSAIAKEFTVEAISCITPDFRSIEFEEPIPVIEIDNKDVEVTRMVEVTDENGTYYRPVVKDGQPVFINSNDDDYYENMRLILRDMLCLMKSDERIDNLFIAMKKKNESGRSYHTTMARLIRSREEEIYQTFEFSDYIFPQHPLFRMSPGSIIIYDSNLNYNVYDLYSGEFELKESGCVNPDVLVKNDLIDYKHPELRWFLEHTNMYHPMGYLEMFKDKSMIIVDGEEIKSPCIDYFEKDGIPVIDNEDTLSMYINVKCSSSGRYDEVVRLYKLLDFPSGDDFYRILEMKNGSKKAKIITHNSEEEIELTFAPYPKEDKPISLYIYPLLDILDALQIRYHYPRCDGSILISMSKGYW